MRGDRRSGTINCALSTPGYLLALLRELSHVPRGLTENAEAKQVRKTNRTIFCTRSEKWSENRSSRFEPKILLISISRASGPPLMKIFIQIFHHILLNLANFGGRPMSKSMQIPEKRIETVENHVKTIGDDDCFYYFQK